MNFHTVNSHEWFEQIASHLRVDAGLPDASADHTGGGIICISIPVGRYFLVFGTANETWGADVYIGEDLQESESITLPLSSDTADPSGCAVAIQAAIREFAAKARS